MNKNDQSWPRRHKWLTGVMVFVAILIIGLIALGATDSRHERQDFIQARTAIDTIYADISDKVGRPDDYKSSDTCSSGYSGPYDLITDCVVSTVFIYGVKDLQSAADLSTRIEKVIKSHPDLFESVILKDRENPNTPAPANYVDSYLSWYKSKNGLDCSYGYSYDRPDDRTNLEFKNASKSLKKFSASVSCIGEARAEYFPKS